MRSRTPRPSMRGIQTSSSIRSNFLARRALERFGAVLRDADVDTRPSAASPASDAVSSRSSSTTSTLAAACGASTASRWLPFLLTASRGRAGAERSRRALSFRARGLRGAGSDARRRLALSRCVLQTPSPPRTRAAHRSVPSDPFNACAARRSASIVLRRDRVSDPRPSVSVSPRGKS